MINYFGIVIILLGLFLVIKPDLKLFPKVKPRSVGVQYRTGSPELSLPPFIPVPGYYKLVRIGGLIMITLGILYFFGIVNVGFGRA